MVLEKIPPCQIEMAEGQLLYCTERVDDNFATFDLLDRKSVQPMLAIDGEFNVFRALGAMH